MALRKVTTATLLRGQVYTLRHPDYTPQTPKDSLRFKRGVPLVVEEEKLIRILENLYEEVPDGDGEVSEKPVFRVSRNVDAPDGDDAPRSRRLSADREVKTTANGKKPVKLRR